MRKIDKARFVSLRASSQDENGVIHGHVVYDVRRLRRVKHDDLVELLYEKTLNLYPFAVVEREALWLDANTDAVSVRVHLPLSSNCRLMRVDS
jgi:hypothetical protein